MFVYSVALRATECTRRKADRQQRLRGNSEQSRGSHLAQIVHRERERTTAPIHRTDIGRFTALCAPCSVITRQNATAALGADPGPGDSTSTPAGGQCSYGTDGGGIILNIVKGPSALGNNAKAAVTRMTASALASKAKDTKGDVIYDTLPGIGDGAFVIGTGSSPDKAFTSASLAFNTGDTLVTILLSFHPATSNPVTQVTNLAKAVAPLVPR